jgi:predicted HicB family RNase H-like nuclease
MSNNFLSYKGFYGSVNFSAADEVFYGKLEGVDDLVSFEGTSVKELKANFKLSVDDYIIYCEKNSYQLRKSFKGSFNIRIKPEIHKQAALFAIKQNISLNQFVQKAIEREITLAEEPSSSYKEAPLLSKSVRKSKRLSHKP